MTKNNNRYAKFIEFGYKLYDCIQGQRKEKWWSVGHIIKDLLLNYEQSHCRLWQFYGKILGYLGHNKIADKMYQIAFDLSPNNYKINFSYAFFMLQIGKFNEAKKYFHKAMCCSKYINKDKNLYIGLARTYQNLQQPSKAEYYFILAVIDNNNDNYNNNDNQIRRKCCNYKYKISYSPGHFFYGSFLEKNGRYDEAKEQFKICIKIKSNAINNYKLGDILYKLKEYDESKNYLTKALEIDPYMPMAKRCLNMLDKEIKSNNNNDNNNNVEIIYYKLNKYNIEFDHIWFDKIGIITNEFNRYYDKFVELKYNDTRVIMNINDFQMFLKKTIQINDIRHINIICAYFI